MPYATYRGTLIAQSGGETCGREALFVFRLRQAERTDTKIVYNLEKIIVFYGTSGACAQTEVAPSALIGTATFTTAFKQTGGVCELYIRTDWTELIRGSTWTLRWDNRVIPLNNYSFVIAQPAPGGGKYQTPLTFVGVP